MHCVYRIKFMFKFIRYNKMWLQTEISQKVVRKRKNWSFSSDKYFIDRIWECGLDFMYIYFVSLNIFKYSIEKKKKGKIYGITIFRSIINITDSTQDENFNIIKKIRRIRRRRRRKLYSWKGLHDWWRTGDREWLCFC